MAIIKEGEIQLISTTDISKEWEVFIPKNKTATWSVNAAGFVIQQTAVGTARNATGTMLVHKGGLAPSIGALRLNVRPGTGSQVGLIFNFVNVNSYSILFLERRGPKAYDMAVGEMEVGRFRYIYQQSYTVAPPDILTMIVQQQEQGLGFFVDETKLHSWLNRTLLKGSTAIGLYSQNSTDAIFEGFSAILSTQAITTPKAPQEPSGQDQEMIGANGSKHINKFLSLQKPASKTTVDFSEVFTVPLDSFYGGLYSNSKLNRPASSSPDLQKNTKVQLLDIRPKRWYREYQLVLEELQYAQRKVDRKEKQIKKIEDVLDSPQKTFTEEELDQLEKSLWEHKNEYRLSLRELNDLRDRKGLLLREIRTNGYLVQESAVAESIKNMGYDFQIMGPSPTANKFEPIVVDPQAILKDDATGNATWQTLEAELYKALFTTGAILDYAKEQYVKERDQLVNFNACQKVQQEIVELEEDIFILESNKTLLGPVLTSLGNEKAMWDGDKQTLLNKRLPSDLTAWIKGFIEPPRYSFFSPGVSPYPISPRFEDSSLNPYIWIFWTKARLRLNKFEADLGWTRGLILWGGGESPLTAIALAIYFPEIQIDYFDMTMLYASDYSTNSFVNTAVSVCDHFISKYQNQIDTITKRQPEYDSKITVLKQRRDDIKENGLSRERKNFLAYWNNTDTNHTGLIENQIIYPDVDPLSEFLVSLEQADGKSAPVKTYYFRPTSDGYYNQFGQRLQDFLKQKETALQSAVALFPVLDADGGISSEVIKVVKNPRGSAKDPELPIIKFVETYRITVGWQGYGLGELSHSINLFPGESKELVIEKRTKLTTKVTETKKTEEETKRHITSSFEDNLQDTFSVEEKASAAAEERTKEDTSQTGSTAGTTTETDTSKLDWGVSASGGLGMFSASAQVSGGTSSSKTSTMSNNQAFSAAQSRSGMRASNQSKDILKKNVSNAVRKTANDTSVNNKLEFSSVSSQEFEQETSNKEVIKLENPNIGKTVNYNFFQVQNLYGTFMTLTDAKIIINSGTELVEGAEINDMRVYDVEEFGKIFANSEGADHDVILAAIIARQVMKHYGDFLTGITSGNGAVTVQDKNLINREMLEILSFSGEELAKSQLTTEQLVAKLKVALEHLKGIPFVFHETEIMGESTVTVNAGAYHLEAQIGLLPSTETYLEVRRDIETERQRALVDQLKKQSEARMFFPDIPDTVTHLSFNGALDANEVAKAEERVA